MTKFAPVMHPTLHDHHRVPITYINGKYEVFVGDGMIRIFEEKDLPDILKSRLAMIKAAVINPPNEDPIFIAKAYDCPPNSELFEIGWQPCEGLFVVVIPTKDLTCMRGETDTAYIHQKGFGFIFNYVPTFKYLTNYIQWLHLKQKLKNELKKS